MPRHPGTFTIALIDLDPDYALAPHARERIMTEWLTAYGHSPADIAERISGLRKRQGWCLDCGSPPDPDHPNECMNCAWLKRRRELPNEVTECPNCGSPNLRDKGSFDKCMDCGERIPGSEERVRRYYPELKEFS